MLPVSLFLDVHTYVYAGVHAQRLRRLSSIHVTLHLNFLRWDLSLSLGLGWQSVNPSTLPDSGPHSAGFTGAMDSHAQHLHRFEFRSSFYKASILTFLSTKQSPWHYQLRNHIYTKYLIFNISSTSLCCGNSMIV